MGLFPRLVAEETAEYGVAGGRVHDEALKRVRWVEAYFRRLFGQP